jgi:hypothetical protein
MKVVYTTEFPEGVKVKRGDFLIIGVKPSENIKQTKKAM